MVNMIEVSMGMLIGMIIYPLLMKSVKRLFHHYKVNNILKNLIKQKNNEKEKA